MWLVASLYGVGSLLCVLMLYQTLWKWVMEAYYNAPPIVTGWLPFLGCIFQFGAPPGPAYFIKKCRDKVRITPIRCAR